MRYLRCIEISLLCSLASFGCDEVERDVPEGTLDVSLIEQDAPEGMLDMSLLEQDDEGEWYAPLNEDAPDDLASRDDPAATFFPMHNHLVGTSGIYSHWAIHRNGGHGTVCGFYSDFAEHCANVSAYVGGSFAGIYDVEYCGGGFVRDANCLVY